MTLSAGFSMPNGNNNFNFTANPRLETANLPVHKNLFFQGASNITGISDNIATQLDEVPLFGGMLGASTRLNGEILALPAKATGTAGIITGSIVELPGKAAEGTFDLASKGFSKASNLSHGVANKINATADGVAQMQEQVPVIGGVLGAGSRLGGEVIALPSKLTATTLGISEKIASFSGDVVSAPFKTAGNILKKL